MSEASIIDLGPMDIAIAQALLNPESSLKASAVAVELMLRQAREAGINW